MALDGIALRAITHELQPLVGGRIHKIHQPSDHDIVLQIRSKGANFKLLLSANPTYPRLHITEASFHNPLNPPMFCMLLRKHCEQGTILDIEQVGMERIIHIHIRQRDELGDITTKRLTVELMGRHSNIILVEPESGNIMDSIQHINAEKSRYRIVLPGSKYLPPPEQNKANLLELSKQDLINKLQEISGTPEPNQIISLFTGISPLNAKEIIYRANGGQSEAGQSLIDVFRELAAQLQNHQYDPNMVETEQKRSVFSVISLTHLKGDKTSFPNVNQLIETYYSERAARDTVKQKSGNLQKIMQNELQKNKKKKTILMQTIEEAKRADRYRIMGELLIANLHQVNKGDTEIEVVNYYDPAQASLKIPLDQSKSPADNAQRFFKKYNKQKKSLTHAEEQLKITENEINYLEGLLLQLEDASLQDLEEIREELEREGYVRRKPTNRRTNKKNTRPALLRYTSSDGIPIYVGKNNLQNDYLTNRFARNSDIWLHTKDIPGSHVLIRGKDYSQETLEEAAMLAAYYSKGKESSQVPVDYTEIRHVRKPAGAKPGYVIYDHHKTIFVTPDANKIKSMPVQQEIK